MQRTKLGRNLKPGDVVELYDHTVYPYKTATVEVQDVHECRSGVFSGRRRWTITYRVLKVSRGAWFWHQSHCYSDDRYPVVSA